VRRVDTDSPVPELSFGCLSGKVLHFWDLRHIDRSKELCKIRNGEGPLNRRETTLPLLGLNREVVFAVNIAEQLT
jgi:hypothetical protein